jgi:protein TonB
MLLQLPTFHAMLAPCPVSAAALTPHEKDQFCGSCQRVVQDFSQSENPVADLAAARAASPDGRVCGSFRREQVVVPPAPTLSRRLRWFVLALVLVVGQGLTAREALAQVRRAVPHKVASQRKHAPAHKPKPKPEQVPTEAYYQGGIESLEVMEETVLPLDSTAVYTYVEQMPQLPGGGGNAAIVAYIQQRVKWPVDFRDDMGGRVFVAFIVGKDGQVREARIVKGLHPLLDAETLRVVQALPAFTPGRQGGRPVAVSFTVPITFKLN